MKCPKHPKYKAFRPPAVACKYCELMHDTRKGTQWVSIGIAERRMRKGESPDAVAKALRGVSRDTVRKLARALREQGVKLCQVAQAPRGVEIDKDEKPPAPIIKGQVKAKPTPSRKLPKGDEVFRYILTAAQNNTKLFDAAWVSLHTLAFHYGAEIMVSRFTYDKASHNTGRKPGTEAGSDQFWYDKRIEPFIQDGRVKLAPGLVWCGEMNILPTAVRPLSGLEAYTGRDSAVIPHVKIAMESVASVKPGTAKFLFTTGAVTQRNYVQKKAGQKAEFHHCYGALLVEVNSDGDWWCRQLNADSEGVIHDLDLRADGDSLVSGQTVEAINWGDIHQDAIDRENFIACWGGEDSLVQLLKPTHQFLHDSLDFRRRSHHDRGNPHKRYQRFAEDKESVEEEIEQLRRFIKQRERNEPFSTMVVVDSNHDSAFERWLREGDYRSDPANAVFFLEAQLAKYKAIRSDDKYFHLLRWALQRRERGGSASPLSQTIFLQPDESFVICPDHGGGIECGIHGHQGPNGARGSPIGFAKMGRKANTGHSHSAGIFDGIYTAGLSGKFDQEYNVGPSSWSHTHTITHRNAKRQQITVWKGKAHAERRKL